MTERFKESISEEYNKLIAACSRNFSDQELVHVHNAFELAREKIGDKTWSNGDPVILHSIAVAQLAANEIGLASDSVISALMHNVYTEEEEIKGKQEIEKLFGKAVCEILDGLIKINAINTDNLALQSENFRRLMLVLSGDVRVILIKIADKLQDMRTLDRFPHTEHKKHVHETMHLYAPLAHRLGLYKINSELQDLSLKYLHPKDYRHIVDKLKETDGQRKNFVSEFVKPVEVKLKKRGFDFEMKARTKSIFSIWNKMKKKGVDFDEVFDLFAIRIILNSKPDDEKSDCWQAFSVVTEEYQSNPERLRDWITIPKSNGYESLHTTVLGPGKRWVEVQIRTHRMDNVAENGLAAHWRYKGGKGSSELDGWLKNIREILENPEMNPVDFIEEFKVNIYEDEIFVFTPKGDLKKLPAGSTLLDFAYEIHSAIGDHCTGGKVNDRMVTLKHKLKNGDHISVATSNNQKPKLDWLEFVVTSKAKSHIKSSLNEEQKKQADNGKEMLLRKLKNWKIAYNDQVIRDLLKHYRLKLAADLYYNIAIGKIDPLEIKEVLSGGKEEETVKDKLSEILPASNLKDLTFDTGGDFLVIDNDIRNINYKLAQCCNPIFGDDIFGFVTIREGIKIHRMNCPNAPQMFERYPYRVIKARWKDTGERNSFQTTIHISGTDEMGLVSDISHIVSKDVGVQMRSISVNSENGNFEGTLRVYVNDLEHLDFLIKKLRNVRGVLSVGRADNIKTR
ncbi:bifunctional (p)ppGpp synthetase/guanosine-3',5'-bis(diphosphate) 3'-pyrophosphohydrolase [Prolixibacter sp. SD074]|uniref:RelA/SpoT family protein n=1 Tax=Prolixibacter sp. SD074 TaxID=2652391 RepID=UPI00127C96A6|nr:RelA/SpoT family protein [Prolixibacter sp. SD074]GET28712.1 GTP pyrophosphokinase [Prolixibacter sp. SD074]